MIIIGDKSAVNHRRLPQNFLRNSVAKPSPMTNSKHRLITDMITVRPSACK